MFYTYVTLLLNDVENMLIASKLHANIMADVKYSLKKRDCQYSLNKPY